MLSRLLNRLRCSLSPKQPANLIEYWRDRVAKYGKQSVLNLGHAEEAFDEVTRYQKDILFPLLELQLNHQEKLALDFGCGPGRFTVELAEIIKGEAIGVDISSELFEFAPTSAAVSYRSITTDILPFADASFDVAWSCLVLGGVPDSDISKTISEIERVLRPNGLFFYVENTEKVANTPYWFFRKQETYIRLAKFCNPKVLGSYKDMGQTITIFAGRKVNK